MLSAMDGVQTFYLLVKGRAPPEGDETRKRLEAAQESKDQGECSFFEWFWMRTWINNDLQAVKMKTTALKMQSELSAAAKRMVLPSIAAFVSMKSGRAWMGPSPSIAT